MISDCAFVRLENGVRLAYVEQGSREGAAIVMLHGYSDTHRSFDLMRPHLPRAWRTIAVTQRGHGLSDKPQTGYAMRDFAADVAGLLNALDIERAIIVGHSMGAAVALQVAATYPERVAGLVLMGAFASFGDKAEVDELAATVEAFGEELDPEFVLAFQESTCTQMIPQRFLETVVNESLKCPTRVWREALGGILGAQPVACAEQVRAPAALIWGDSDAYIPHADQLQLRDAMPSARLYGLAGVGHAVHWEQPERCAQLVRAFVTEIDEPGLFRDAVFG
jgi:non-heme chloroperoxidase